VHGETNALIKHADYSDAVIYCTTSPCPACAGLIVTSRRISRVIYGQHYREPLDAIGMMLRRGIIVRELNKMVTEGW
jgi:Deoxycytidylate deaminase